MKLDWQNDSDYAYTEQLGANGWAFEFLRRNPGYQADFEKIRKLEAEITAELGPYEGNEIAWRADERVRKHVPPLQPGESEKQWMLRSSLAGREPLRIWYLDPVREKWGLKDKFPDPACPSSPEFETDPLGGFPLFPNYEEVAEFFSNDSAILPDDDGYVDCDWGGGQQLPETPVVVFDVKKPLAKQLAVAEAILNRQVAAGNDMNKSPKPKKVPNHSVLFRTYLRVWDASVKGIGPKEIGDIIFPEPNNTCSIDVSTKKASKTLKQVKPYVARKYRNLPFLI